MIDAGAEVVQRVPVPMDEVERRRRMESRSTAPARLFVVEPPLSPGHVVPVTARGYHDFVTPHPFAG